MHPPLAESVILITGASSGLGAEFARQLAGRARALVLVARRAERLAVLREELVLRRPDLLVSLAPCDLEDRAATDAMLTKVEQEFGQVDILVNNAGFAEHSLYEQASWDRTRRMIELNCVALAHLSHRVLATMAARRRGAILNVSSLLGLASLPGYAAYAGTKHFVTGFTEALRCEARAAGVVVTGVYPGPMATEFDEVAGRFAGVELPPWAQVSVERCVRAAIRGLERDRALVVPGFLHKLVAVLVAVTPRPAQRCFCTALAWWLRRRLAAGA